MQALGAVFVLTAIANALCGAWLFVLHADDLRAWPWIALNAVSAWAAVVAARSKRTR